MSKELGEALGEVLALLKSAEDPDTACWEVSREVAPTAVNFLRDHGPAIAAALRAAEGDALNAARYRWLRDEANTARKSDPMVVTNPIGASWEQELLDGEELDAAIDQARGVPLDAADGAEGVGGA